MEIKCDPSPFIEQINDLLRELSRVRFFEYGLLIGSWPMVVYSQVYGLIYGLRTNDIDFAVVNTARKVDGTPLPDLLGQLGYEVLTDYQSGIEKYVQDTFEIEFLMHRRGGVAPPAVNLPAWQVTAQPPRRYRRSCRKNACRKMCGKTFQCPARKQVWI
ncbi:MAG: GSU2403 family nucleotidyltransferase fold protein [Desulfuromonadaceae bacterium]